MLNIINHVSYAFRILAEGFTFALHFRNDLDFAQYCELHPLQQLFSIFF